MATPDETQSVLSAYGWAAVWGLLKAPGYDPRPKYGPPAPMRQERWCVACDVRHVAFPFELCWLCGGPMTMLKPAVWNNFAPAEGSTDDEPGGV